MSTEIRPFRVDVPHSDLADLRSRLAATRWPAQLPGGGWSRGVPVAYLKDLVEYWRDGYDWREHEAALNEFPQFTTEIDGQSIHFLHVRSPEPDALPLVITHSWPNSIVEFTDVIGPLTDPRAHGADAATAFHVIAPSLPGFGFSPFPEPPDEAPWTAERVARAWAELVRRLGYDHYGVHGNDAGALVSPLVAVTDPERVVGVHITGGLGIPTGDPAELEGVTDEDRMSIERMAALFTAGSGYAPYLTNRPQTLAYGWHDSPVAQLAWLLERFKEFDGWPGVDGEPSEPIDHERLLTNATLYWLTQTAASSSWTYYDGAAAMPINQAVVPTGVSHGGPEVFRRLAERANDIVRWSDHKSGSHMVAMAVPHLLVTDIREFFAGLRRERAA